MYRLLEVFVLYHWAKSIIFYEYKLRTFGDILWYLRLQC